MTEREINERRNWKAEVFPYDYYIPDNSQEHLYCLTDKQAEILRGIIVPLGWRTRWWTNEDEPIDRDEIESFRDDLIRRLMMSCCGNETPIRYRWTEDGTLQASEDGGENWEDSPQSDPRNNSTVYPPIPDEEGVDSKCLAATSAAQLIKSQIGDNLTDDMSRFTLGELIQTWIDTYLQTSNPFLALINIAVNQIFALVISVLRVALTDPVYETLKCIFYCNMAEDASFDNASWAQVRSDITDQIGGVAGIFLEHLVYLLGPVGLTNISRSNFASSDGLDCSDCTECAECGVGWVEWSHFGGMGTIINDPAVDHYVQVQSETISAFGAQGAGIYTTTESCCQLDHVDFTDQNGTMSIYYSPCGHDPSSVGGNINVGAGASIGDSMNMITVYGGTSVFTAKIYFVQ